MFETIIIKGIEYDIMDLRENDDKESVYVITKDTDLIDSYSEDIVAVRKTKEGVIDFIESNPPKYNKKTQMRLEMSHIPSTDTIYLDAEG